MRRFATSLVVACSSCWMLRAGAAASSRPALLPMAPAVRSALDRLPLWFEAHDAGDSGEKHFIARSPGRALVLSPAGVMLALADSPGGTGLEDVGWAGDPSVPGWRESSSVRIKFRDGGSPRLVGLEVLPGKSHWLVGSDPAQWRTDLPQFAKVRYERVYPGIDLVFYGRQQQLEFDFMIEPGADPSVIALDIEGAGPIRQDPSGDLRIELGPTELLIHRPRVFQEKAGQTSLVRGDFEVNSGKTLRFTLGPYDHTVPLIIDPVVSFSSYAGGAVSGLEVDPSGNIYAVSSAFTPKLPTTPGGFQSDKAGGASDVFVMKFDPGRGMVLYATYLGGSVTESDLGGSDIANAIAVDSDGNAVVTGYTSSRDFPLANAAQSQLGGTYDAFVAKLNPTGSGLVYSTYLGGTPRFEMEPLSIDFGMVQADQIKNATIKIRNTGSVPFEVCADTGGGAVTFVGTTASCLTGFENEHVNFNARISVAPHAEISLGLAFDPLGRGHDKGKIGFYIKEELSVFAEVPWKGEGLVAGFPPEPTPPPDTETYRNKPPFFIVRGDGDDFATAVAVDAAGNAYVTGSTDSANFPAPASLEPYHGTATQPQNTEAFVAKLSAQGTPVFSTYLGGSGSDRSFGVAVDSQSNCYVAGETTSSDWQATTSLHPLPSQNGFVVKLNGSGTARAYSTVVGGALIRGLAVDEAGAAYLTGVGGVAELITPLAFQKTFGGGRGDAFVGKLDPNGSSLLYFTLLGGTGEDEGAAVAVDAAGSAYVAGRTQSPNFPLQEPFQSDYAGGETDFDAKGDAFVTQFSADGSQLVFSSYLGGPSGDRGSAIRLGPGGMIAVGGVTSGAFPLTNALPGWSTASGGFVALVNRGVAARLVQLWEKIEIPAPTGNEGAAAFKVQFVRTVQGQEVRVDAPILAIRPGAVTVRVPPALLGPTSLDQPPTGTDANTHAEVWRVAAGQQLAGVLQMQPLARQPLVLQLPQPIIVDELDVRPGSPGLRTLTQFVLGAATPNIHTFSFMGRSADGLVGLRILNTERRFPVPLRFGIDDVAAFEPETSGGRLRQILPLSHIPNLGAGDQGIQFTIAKEGLHLIAVEASTDSPGPFPAHYQLHLAGNVGLPRKTPNEAKRGIRLDTLFNHPAPRAQNLLRGDLNVARTALFKFANLAGVNQGAEAVLIPPAAGFGKGTRIRRAADPVAPLDLTTPTATTPDCAAPVPGTVIDFTQVPDPPVPGAAIPSGTICSVLGAADNVGMSLPFTAAGGVPVASLLFDMGSGSEIVDGAGPDLRIVALAGSYGVRVGNTPYYADPDDQGWASLSGTLTSSANLDLAGTGLTSVRYVLVTGAPSVTIDAVQALNVFADEVRPDLGAVMHVTAASIFARRAKDPANRLDPYLELIAPDGQLFGPINDSGFGDDVTQDLSDAALLQKPLSQFGFYRYLVKGHDQRPDTQADGAFFTRLETSGNYDQVEVELSPNGEADTAPQKSGKMTASRQRDSFLFQATPGTSVSIVVNSRSEGLDPMVELFDPEDFLIAANDNGTGRGRNAALLNVPLPDATLAGSPAPRPSTYRLVVSAADRIGTASPLTAGQAHLRLPAAGDYEVKVFTGGLSASLPSVNGAQVSTLAEISKPGALAIDGAGNLFVLGRDSGTISRVSPAGAMSVVAQLGVDPGGWTGIAIDSSGTLYVSHFTANEILSVAPTGAASVLVSGLNHPTGLATDPQGNLYVTSSGKILKIPARRNGLNAEPAGAPAARLAAAHPGSAVDQRAPTEYASGFIDPVSLSFNSAGELLVADRGASQISKVPAGGGTAALFAPVTSAPEALVAAVSGAVFVSTIGGGLSQITPDGKSTALGNGFGATVGLAIDSQGSLYVADQAKNALFKAPRVVPPLVPPSQPAQASLHCLSLRFHRTSGFGFGEPFVLELTSLPPDEPANGELFPDFAFGAGNYASTFLLTSDGLDQPLEGLISIKVPTVGDGNANGLDDFFETARAVSPSTTVGDYSTDFDDGTVKAAWSRAAGSRLGSCRLELVGEASGFEAQFTTEFELIEYAGSFPYSVEGAKVNAKVDLREAANGPDRLSGPLVLTRTSPNELEFDPGTWTNAAGKNLDIGRGVLVRTAPSGPHYRAEMFIDRDNPENGGHDYLDWMLLVADPNDSDQDGVPDLSDAASVPPPPSGFTSIRYERPTVVVSWEGTGRLQLASSPSGPWTELPATTSPFRVTPAQKQQFFRLAPP
ncbi:MAG: SBBP repeat-containing protein [Verrucomicrobiota bacterium]